MPLFEEIAKVENSMENYIISNMEDSWKDSLKDNEVKMIEDRYEQTKQNNVQLEEISCAGFRHKVEIIKSSDKAMNLIGLGNRSRDSLKEIVDLRDDVAYGHPIIGNFSSAVKK